MDLTGFLIWSLLTRVPATKLDGWVAHVRYTLTVLLVTQVHAVCVPIAAPTQGDAQAVHSTLKLIGMTSSRGARGCRETPKDFEMTLSSIPAHVRVIVLVQNTSLQ